MKSIRMASNGHKAQGRRRSNGNGSGLRSKPEHQISLRLSGKVLDNVDSCVARRTVRIPRHTWLLEAIIEKIQREAATRGNDHGPQ
jgi:hypothetical protein